MKKKNIVLYNVIFPIWLMVLFPPILIPVLIGNFIVDSLVVLITMKILKVENIFKNYRSSILGVWGYGFLSDIIGGLGLFATMFISLPKESKFSKFFDNFQLGIYGSPFSNIFSFIYIVICMIIASTFIYIFNKKITLRKTTLNEREKKIVAIALAIITSPYLFLLPMDFFYN